MKTLYDILGVAPNADHKTIRRAYRQLSKAMHPDVGGDTDAFAALSQAHEVLSDPERRAHYDATGQIPNGIDNSISYVLEAVDRAFNSVAVKLAQQECRDMNLVDMLQQMRLFLGAEEKRLKEIVSAFERETVMLEELVNRFTVADGAENFVAKLLQTKIMMLKEKVQEPEMELKATLGAIEELKRYAFERRFVPPPAQGSQFAYILNHSGAFQSGNQGWP